MEKRTTVRSGDVYSVYIEELGKYGVYQIIQVMPESCYVAALDYCEKEMPTLSVLKQTDVLRNHMWRNQGSAFADWIGNTKIPQNYQFIGNMAPVLSQTSSIYGGDRFSQGNEYIWIRDWERIPQRMREEYKKYITSGENVWLHGAYFRKRETCITKALLEAVRQVEELDQFPCLVRAELENIPDDLSAYLAKRPMIRKTVLNGAEGTVDLRKTWLREASINVSKVQELILAPEMRLLHIYGKITSELHIRAEGEGASLALIAEKNKEFPLVRGLHGLKSLFLKEIHKLDVQELVYCFPELRSLHIKGAPGFLKHIEYLPECEKLEELILEDVFGFETGAWGKMAPLKNLLVLEAESIPEAVGRYMKKQYGGKLDILKISKLRKETWIKENLDNPFRHWDGDGIVPEAAYKKVLGAYKKLKKSFRQAETREDILEASITFVRTLNRCNSRYGEFIESGERDDIFEAAGKLYHEIAEPKGIITYDLMERCMDQQRKGW